MKGHRYKNNGWFGEPHRHYLAAKGIKTSRKKTFMGVADLIENSFNLSSGKGSSGSSNVFSPSQKDPKYEVNFVKDGEEMVAGFNTRENALRVKDELLNSGVATSASVSKVDKSFKTFSKKYFVRDELKGNRSSPELHSAFAKGFSKDELRANPDIRRQFGVSLSELSETSNKSNLPEGLSERQERNIGGFDREVSPTITPVPSEPIPEPSVPSGISDNIELKTPGVPPAPTRGFDL